MTTDHKPTSDTPDVSPPPDIEIPDEIVDRGVDVLDELALGYFEANDVFRVLQATGPALIAAYLRGKADDAPSAELDDRLRDWADELDPPQGSAAQLRAQARDLHLQAAREACRGCASNLREKATALMRRASKMGDPR